MRRLLRVSMILTGLVIMMTNMIQAQTETSRSLYDIPPRNLVDAPTSMTLPRGCFDVILRVYPNGGILGNTSIGLTNRFMVGVSYGAEGIIADAEPNWNPSMEFNAKLRLIDESIFLPALAIGFNSQGYSSYDDNQQRYTYKSKGFYAVFSRSMFFYNASVGGHAGVNYSMEHDVDNDDDPSLFFGIDTQFKYNVGFVLEYDIALNDDKSSQRYGRGRGYLNAGLRWLFSENLEIEVIFKNLLNNRRDVNSFGRGLRLTYIEFF